ncbi:MAG: hypothetical protein H7331_07080 [Bacteroidia bacterium]|nr:hypothetical protein [Bacteroidia bacterium]
MKHFLAILALVLYANALAAQDVVITSKDTLIGLLNKATVNYNDVEMFTNGNYIVVNKSNINAIKADTNLKTYNTIQYTATRVIDGERIYFNIIKQGTDSITLVEFNAKTYQPTLTSYSASAINNVERLESNYKDIAPTTTPQTIANTSAPTPTYNKGTAERKQEHKFFRLEAGVTYAKVLAPVINQGEAFIFDNATTKLNNSNGEYYAQAMYVSASNFTLSAGVDYFAGKVNQLGSLDVINRVGTSGQFLNTNNTTPAGFTKIGEVPAQFSVKRNALTFTGQLGYQFNIGQNKNVLCLAVGLGIGNYKDVSILTVQSQSTPIIKGTYTASIATTQLSIKYLYNAGAFYIGPMLAFNRSTATYKQEVISINGGAPITTAISDKEPLSRYQLGLVVRF